MPVPPTLLENPPQKRNWVWFSIQVVLRLFFAVWLRYRARGYEHLVADGGMLLIINHQSFLDPLLVGLPLRRPVSYLARDNLFRVPLVGWVLRRTYVLPINREAASASSLRELVGRLQAGFWVGIFPEGTRSSDGQLGSLKPGFLALLRRANVPVCPVAIAGADRALGRGARILFPGKVRVVFGDILTADQVANELKKGEGCLLELIRARLDAGIRLANEWRDGD